MSFPPICAGTNKLSVMYMWSVLLLLSAAVGLVASQDCDFPSRYFPGLFRAGREGKL